MHGSVSGSGRRAAENHTGLGVCAHGQRAEWGFRAATRGCENGSGARSGVTKRFASGLGWDRSDWGGPKCHHEGEGVQPRLCKRMLAHSANQQRNTDRDAAAIAQNTEFWMDEPGGLHHECAVTDVTYVHGIMRTGKRHRVFVAPRALTF